MFWFIYIIAAISLAFLLSRSIEKYSSIIFLFILVFLLTPAQLNPEEPYFAPSIFTFILNVIFEKNFSFQVLRPLVLSIPIFVTFSILTLQIKKKFF
tara:strand:- start:378 stop:668 length:291 start_codon:yes stop_codon:yes gene_type:complete